MVRDPGVEPSTLMLHIADGSILQDRTFHVNASYHGWFSIQTRTFHVNAPFRGWFHSPRPNLPHFGPESWTVRVSVLESSTLRLNIADGPCLRSEPSMLKADIVDGSGFKSRTFHAETQYHGRFHSPGPNLPR